jgi:hypothetical protein
MLLRLKLTSSSIRSSPLMSPCLAPPLEPPSPFFPTFFFFFFGSSLPFASFPLASFPPLPPFGGGAFAAKEREENAGRAMARREEQERAVEAEGGRVRSRQEGRRRERRSILESCRAHSR